MRCACGQENPPGSRFCNGCGTAIAAAPARDAPRAYTPPHLAEKILTSRAALEGERKQVTVLFADVKGSMELAEQVDPEDWHHIMDRFFAILSDGVHRFEGTVNQYTGDGIMALFGAPVAHEDHAQRACWAALHLRDALRRYGDDLRLERGLSFSVRMGLNSGEVVVGRIGDDLRMDYTAQGHTVGLAQRMEQLAEPGKALLTEHTARLATGYFVLRDLGAARVKGVATPLHVFELEGPGAIRTRFQASRARGLARFVGRDAEMATLERALERAVAGEGQIVGISAEAGVGKSRLCWEFAERCRARAILVREAHAVSHGHLLPFLPILELLRGVFDVDDRDSAQAVRNKVAGALLLLDRTLEPTLPVLFDFLAVPDPQRPAPSPSPEERQRLLLGAVRRIIELRSEREPGVWLIEDLHWIDGGSDAVLVDLAEIVARTRTLLLVNFRPQYRADWMQRPHYQAVSLQPLGSEAVAVLLRDLLGTDPSLDGLAARLEERTGGNAFFIEESVRTLVEAGQLAGEAGAYRLAAPIDRLGLPATVQAVLAARIDRLGEREKHVLQVGSVVGATVPESVLEQTAGVSRSDLDGALRRLVEAEFLDAQMLQGQTEYAFRHPLTQEVAYGSQLAEGRARVHAAVAQALEGRHHAALDAHAADIAHHWDRAGDARRAIVWLRRAANHAGIASVIQGARQWRRVLDLAASPSVQDHDSELTARERLLMLGVRVGEVAIDASALFREGMELAERVGNAPARARLIAAYGGYRLLSGETAGADIVADLREAVRLSDLTDDVGAQISARVQILGALVARDVDAVIRVADEGIERVGTDRERTGPDGGVFAWGFFLLVKVIALAWCGRFAEGAALVEELAASARGRSDPYIDIQYHTAASMLARLRGDAEASLAHARQLLVATARVDSRLSWAMGRVTLGSALAANGQLELAAESFSEVLLGAQDRTGVRFWVLGTLAGLGDVRLQQRDFAAARAIADDILERTKDIAATIGKAQAYLLLARISLRSDPGWSPERVERWLADAANQAAQTGYRMFEPDVLECRAELAAACGDAAGRVARLREALGTYTDVGADGHVARVSRLLAT
jgi:class 3 adenylate cyclase